MKRSMRQIPKQSVHEQCRVDEGADDITFRSVRGGNAPRLRACICALKRDASTFTVVKCPMRRESTGRHPFRHGPKDSYVGERGAAQARCLDIEESYRAQLLYELG